MSKRKALRTTTPIRRRSALMVSAAAVALMGLPFSALAEPGAARLPRGEDVIREPQATFPAGQVRLPRGEDVVREPQATFPAGQVRLPRGEDVVREPQAQAPLAPHALPRDPNVVAGGATFDETGARLDVNQSTDRVVIDWRSFDIGQDAEVNFYQPGSSAIAVNRISSGGLPSQIAGVLRANGTVVILNPNGVIFSATSRVDVGGLVASTGRIDVDQFMAGGNRFDFTDATSGSIVAGGSINIAEAGLAAFVAPHVRNDGIINARLGRVALAAGETFTLDLAGDRLIELGLGAHTPLVENYGSILVDGGRVQLSAVAAGAVVDQVINAGGLISVASAHDDGGTIVLEGADGGVTVGGELNASGATGGGDIAITGATITTTADAVLNADATQDGDGGSIMAVADGRGDYAGALSARGGAAGGDGGFVETSGKTVGLDAGLRVDTSAVDGENGDWLIDPVDLVVGAGEAAAVVNNLASGNVILQAENSITVDSAIDSSAQANANTLSLNDENSDGDLTVTLNAGIRLAATQHLNGQASQINVRNGGIIQNGVDVALAGAAINIGAGDYLAGTNINKNGLTLTGEEGARIVVTGAPLAGLTIRGDDVTVQNLAINGPVVGDQSEIDWGAQLSTVGIVVMNGAENATITGNDITNIRTGIRLDGRGNAGLQVVDNYIENTKGAILVQYTDGAGLGISNNRQGPLGNEWGIVLNLNTGTPLQAHATAAAQANIMGFSDGNNDMTVLDRAYAWSNRSHVSVDDDSVVTALDDFAYGNGLGNERQALGTIQAGVIAVAAGGHIDVRDGTYAGNFTVDKGLTVGGGADAILTGQMLIRTGEDVTVNGLHFELTGDQAIDIQPYNAAMAAEIAGMTLTLNGTEFDGAGRGVWGLLMASDAPITLNLNDTSFTGMVYAAYLGGGHTINATGSTFDVERAFSAPSNGATFDLTDNTFAGVAVNVGANQRIGGLTMSDNTYTGAAGDAAAVRVSAGSASYLLTGDRTLQHGIVFAAANSTINAAIAAAQAQDTVYVGAGNYVGNVLINKNGLTLVSDAGRDATTIQGVAGAGSLGAVVIQNASGVTVGTTDHGFTILGFDSANPGIENGALYIQGANSDTLIQGNRITAGGDEALMSEWSAAVSHVTVDGNIIDGKTYVGAAPATGNQFTVPNVSRQLVVMGGGGNTSNIVFTNNQITGDSGLNTGVTIDAAAATITGNTFASTTGGFGSLFRARGSNNTISGNTFDLGGLAATGATITLGTGVAADAAAFQAVLAANGLTSDGVWAEAITGTTRGLYRNIQGAVNESAAGGTVNVLEGLYDQALAITKDVTVLGAGAGLSILRPTALLATGVGHKYDANMKVSLFVSGANHVVIDGLTVDGANLAGNAGVFWTNASGELRNVHITNVAPFSGLQTGQGLAVDATAGHTTDLLVSNVQFDNWNKNAIDVVTGQGAGTGGGAINLTVNNSTFTGRGETGVNAQNGVVLWERAGGTINADISGSSFSDLGYSGAATAAGVLVYGGLNGHTTVSNSSFDGVQTYLALDGGTLNELDAAGGNVFDGVAADSATLEQLLAIEDHIDHGVDYAGNGLIRVRDGQVFVTESSDPGAITRAAGLASAGDTVNVGSGTYGETVAINKSLTLSGAGMGDTSITGGMTLTGAINGLNLSGFTISGGASSVIRGSGSVTDLTIDDVRIDGGNLATRAGISGGQYGGDISITNSEFANIGHWVVFDTRSGSGTPAAGTEVSSFTFSGNLVDNVKGGITVRQNGGGTGLVSITGNTIRNIGDSTQSSGGIFKIFNAGTVDFTGNTVSDIGTNASLTSDGVAYGAALLMRGVQTLNVTDNSFTNVHMAVATEKNGFAAPTLTTFTGNTFTNTGYAFFMPTDALTGGSVVFGAGNAINSGADTVQHIVWRGAAGLDLTGVMFDGKLGSEMSLAELLGLEDLITHGTDVSGAGLARVKAGEVFVTTASASVQRGVNLAASGDTVHVAGGAYALPGELSITKSLTLLGAGAGATIFNSASTGYGVFVAADGVTLAGFSLNGNPTGSYGIKVQPNSGAASARVHDFTITDVAISGTRKTGLDLNGVVGGVIDGVTVTGATAGNGLAFTDSADITVRNTTTSGNAWGGLALYQSNRFFDQQVGDIMVEASNVFGETRGLYTQDESAQFDFGALTLLGFDFTVRNDAFQADAAGYTFYKATLQSALDYGVALGAGDSYVEGWNGTGDTGHFHVGLGDAGAGLQALSIQTAFDKSAAGDLIDVASGAYAEVATLDGQRDLRFGVITIGGLNLTSGAAGTVLSGDVTAGAGGLDFDAFVVLGGDTRLAATGGDIRLLEVDGQPGGQQSLVVDGSDVVHVGQVGASKALSSLTVSGADVTALGARTTGTQAYAGARVGLSGAFVASGFSVAGAAELGASTLIDVDGDVALDSVDGAHDLTVDASGAVNLGAVGSTTALTRLDVSGASITSVGATTSGAQAYDAATVGLSGAYAAGGDVTVDGATTLNGDVTVSGDDVTLASVNGAHALTVDASGAAALGAVGSTTALTSLDVSGASITTVGAVTTGAQSYDAATVGLSGAYAAGGDVTVDGATTLNGDVTVSGDDVTLASVNGAHALTVDASGAAALGAVGSTTALTSLDVSGASITSVGARTVGGQSWTAEAIRLAGGFSTDNGDFSLTGLTTLDGATTIATAGGDIAAGAINGSGAGGQSLSMDAGSGAVAVGSMGAGVRLGAVLVRSSGTVLDGSTYAGDSLRFQGSGAGSTVRLTQALTIFNTAPLGGAAGDITVEPDLIGTTNGAQSVAFVAGAGLGNDGDITLGNLGTEAVRLGAMSVSGGDFHAQTVKLAGDYTAVLSGDQVFSAHTLDTLGDVNAQVAGDDTGPIIAGGSVVINAGGFSSGSISAGGTVSISGADGVDRGIVAGGSVDVASSGGSVTGSIDSGGDVGVTAFGAVDLDVDAAGSVDLTSTNSSINSVVNGGGDVSLNAAGPIIADVTTPGAVSIGTPQLINVTVNAGSLVLNAPGGTIGGDFGSITTDPNGTFNVNGQTVVGSGGADARQFLIDQFLAPAGGLVGSTGQIQLPVNLAVALIAPAGEGQGNRRPIIVNSVDRLGELLRLGYTAIIVQLDSGEEYEQEIDLAASAEAQPAG